MSDYPSISSGLEDPNSKVDLTLTRKVSPIIIDGNRDSGWTQLLPQCSLIFYRTKPGVTGGVTESVTLIQLNYWIGLIYTREGEDAALKFAMQFVPAGTMLDSSPRKYDSSFTMLSRNVTFALRTADYVENMWGAAPAPGDRLYITLSLVSELKAFKIRLHDGAWVEAPKGAYPQFGAFTSKSTKVDFTKYTKIFYIGLCEVNPMFNPNMSRTTAEVAAEIRDAVSITNRKKLYVRMAVGG